MSHSSSEQAAICNAGEFTAVNVALAPAAPGVYLLYRGPQVIYIGVAAYGTTIRERLQRHQRGEEGPCTQAASEFEYEATSDPLARYRVHLRAYFERSGGQVPSCNERHAS